MWKNNWRAGFSHNGQRWIKLVCCETNDKSIMESNYHFTFRNDMFQISNCTNMTDHRRFFVFGHRYKINHSLSVAPTPRGRVGSSSGPPSPQGASFGQANVVVRVSYRLRCPYRYTIPAEIRDTGMIPVWYRCLLKLFVQIRIHKQWWTCFLKNLFSLITEQQI